MLEAELAVGSGGTAPLRTRAAKELPPASKVDGRHVSEHGTHTKPPEGMAAWRPGDLASPYFPPRFRLSDPDCGLGLGGSGTMSLNLEMAWC